MVTTWCPECEAPFNTPYCPTCGHKRRPRGAPPPPVKAVLSKLAEIRDIIEAVEVRCMAVDGPVTPTSEEINEEDLRRIWEIVSADYCPVHGLPFETVSGHQPMQGTDADWHGCPVCGRDTAPTIVTGKLFGQGRDRPIYFVPDDYSHHQLFDADGRLTHIEFEVEP